MPRFPNHRLNMDKNGRRRHVSIPIPPVEREVVQAVESHVLETQPGLVERAAWDEARLKVEKLQRQCEQQEQKLQKLVEAKAKAEQTDKAAQEERTTKLIAKMERKMRQEFERQQQEKNDALELELKEAARKFEQASSLKKQRLTQDEEGEVGEEPTVESESNKKKEPLESELKLADLEKAKKEMNSLKEAKGQMAWLLRQVITAEKKRDLALKRKDTASS